MYQNAKELEEPDNVKKEKHTWMIHTTNFITVMKSYWNKYRRIGQWDRIE